MLRTKSAASKIPWLFSTLMLSIFGILRCYAFTTACLDGSVCEGRASIVRIGGHDFCCPTDSVLTYRFDHDNAGLTCNCTPARARRADLTEECMVESGGEYFGCSNSTQVIALSQVNDNYCDCQDGSDEPSTAACAGTELGLFKCAYADENILASSKVDDGICDCCDGLDEPQNLCTNTCKEKFYLKKLAQQSYLDEIALGIGRMQVERSERREKRETKEIEGAWEQIRRMNLTLVRLQQDFDAKCRAEGLPKREFFLTEKLEKTIQDVDERIRVSRLGKEELQDVAMQLSCGIEASSEVFDEISELQPTALQAIALALRCNNLQQLHEFVKNTQASPIEADDTIEKLSIWQKRVWSINPRDCYVQNRLGAKRSEIEERKAFVGLPEKCEKAVFGKYNYTICPRVQVYQDSLLLGKFAKLTLLIKKRTKEDYLSRPATAKVRFAGGSMCDKVPRSVELYLYCNASSSILRLDEPQTCKYEIHMSSPGGCYDELIDIFKLEESTLQSARSGVEWSMWYERNFTALLLLLAASIIGLFVLLLCCALSKYAQGDVELDVKTPTEENTDEAHVASELSTS